MVQQPETYIVTLQCGAERISQGFSASSDAEAREKAADILASDRRRVGRKAVVTLTRSDGTTVALLPLR